MLETVIIIVHLVGALGIVGFVLIQQGKGAETGASFGSGASGTVFGSQGSSNFLSRLTAVLATVFFATSLGLAFYAKDRANSISQMGLPDPAVLEVPVQQMPLQDDIPQVINSAVDVGDNSVSDVPVVE